LGTLNTVLQEAGAALSRLYELLDTPAAVVSPSKPIVLNDIKGKLEFDKVSFRYGDAVTLDDISFTISPGQTLALVGPSGGGKSTIINLLPRLYDPASGVIRLDGHDLRELDLKQLRSVMALVSQDSLLFNDTVRANITFGQLDADDMAVHAAAEAAAADGFIRDLPEGYATVVGEEGNRLSGGQRQRIAIARAMLRDAPILLLDEPTSALDAATEKQIQGAMQTLAKGRTTLIVAHRLATVRHADYILVIDEGRVAEAGNHETLIAKAGIYADLCQSQHFY
jgi:subfamily B ATP-binding cassette protein MsbA